jgi:Secretion system C-terminal sorting domain
MKKTVFKKFLILSVLSLASIAFSQVQLIDSFKDGNFTTDPVWTGDVSNWQVVTKSDVANGISGSYTLRLNGAGNARGKAYLTTQRGSWGTEQSWGFWIGRRNQSVDNTNRSYVWLWANQANLSAHGIQGYRIRFGDASAENRIVFEKVVNSVPQELFVSEDYVPAGLKDIGFVLWIVRFEDSHWQVFTSPLPQVSSSGALATVVPDVYSASEFQGEFVDSSFKVFDNGYIGVMTTFSLTPDAQTAAEFDQFYFSDHALSLLPVELSSFTGNYVNHKVELEWETKTEVNNYGFDVEKDNGTSTWQKIGFVEGNGNSNSPKYYNFTDDHITYGKVSYRLKQIDNDGTFAYSNVIDVEAGNLPKDLTVAQNYPNPFNPATKIQFAVKVDREVKLNVYNAIGCLVATLFNGKADANRVYEVEFNGKDLTSGIYIYRLESGSFIESHKMLLVK